MNRRALAIAILLFSSVAPIDTAARADEWSRFRGPNGQGQSEAAGIPIEWTENDYNWKVELPGSGISSPVVRGGRVFVTSGDPTTGTRYVSCLDVVDGKTIWQREFPAATHRVHQQNNFASSTPAVDDQRVYVAWATPEEYTLLALLQDGQDSWRINLGAYQSQHGFGTSPIVVDDSVIITNDQDDPENCFLIAVDRFTGQTRWKLPRRHTGGRQNACYSTPCVRETAQGRELIVNSWAHGVSSHSLETGVMNWELPVFKLRTVSSPIFVGDLILGSCGEGSGNNTVVAVRPPTSAGQAAEVAYKIDRTSAPYCPSMCAAGDLVFLWGDRGIVTCIDGPTGKIHWRERVGGDYFGSPVRVADRIYCISTAGEVVVLAAANDFKVLARNPLNESSESTPAVADGRMYLRTASHLVSIGGK